MRIKKCTKCSKDKTIDCFRRRSGKQSHLYTSWCIDCLNSNRMIYYRKNIDHEREQNRRWHQENKPWLDPAKREYHNAWRRNSDRRAEWANRDALERGAEGSFTSEEWSNLCDKYNNICLKCKRGDVGLSVDHVIPLSKGGTNYIENIQPLCQPCNSSKGAQTIDYRGDYN